MPKKGTRSSLFGAKPHDPTIWQSHPLVTRAEASFDIARPKGRSSGLDGWVRVKYQQDLEGVPTLKVAEFVDGNDSLKSADLFFWGEFDCPVAMFERMPRLRKLQIAMFEPTDEDNRLCWSVGIWLNAAQV